MYIFVLIDRNIRSYQISNPLQVNWNIHLSGDNIFLASSENTAAYLR